MLNVSNHTMGLNQFPSPYGVSFILIGLIKGRHELPVDKFPSPYGVSFILTSVHKERLPSILGKRGSVSLRSIIHSYIFEYYFWQPMHDKFPSPCGVLFILIDIMSTLNDKLNQVFLSPYGISFILILWLKKVFYYNMFLEYFCKITLIFKS